jgi:hypothetical protein
VPDDDTDSIDARAEMANDNASKPSLAAAMEELGYACTVSEAAFSDVLRQVRSPASGLQNVLEGGLSLQGISLSDHSAQCKGMVPPRITASFREPFGKDLRCGSFNSIFFFWGGGLFGVVLVLQAVWGCGAEVST